MPLERIRTLSLLVIAATVAAWFSGDLETHFLFLLFGTTIPLWFKIPIAKIREYKIWRFYGIITFALVITLYLIEIPVKNSIFLLVIFCIIYEFYGEKRRSAPTRLISLLSFLILLYQARIESGLNMALGILIYTSSVIWCLMAFHLGKDSGFQSSLMVRRYFWVMVRLGAVIFIIGLGLFWMIPRLPSQTLASIPSLGNDRLSGFSDRVTLSDIGSLKLSRKHVMDLTPLSGKLHSRYLKGKVLDQYHRGIWSGSIYSVYYPARDKENRYLINESQGPVYEYRIDLEALQGNTIFFMDNLEELKGSLSPMKMMGTMDHISIMRGYPIATTYFYKASPGPIPSRARLKTNRKISENFNFFKSISDDIVETDQSIPQKVRAIRSHLVSNYEYSLEINNQGVRDPLEDFLINSKKGHCELFASSMVLLLRSQGIPARLVTGFYIPDPFPSANFHYITESDAHAWVEVHFNGAWHTVDPTPTTNFSNPGSFETQMATLRRFWRNNIMTWDHDSQVSLLANIEALGDRLAPYWRNYFFVLFSTPLFLWLMVSFYRNFFDSAHRLTRLSIKLEDRLRTSNPSLFFKEPLRDILLRLPLEQNLRSEFLAFFTGYQNLRFGPNGWDREKAIVLLNQGLLLKSRLSAGSGGSH